MGNCPPPENLELDSRLFANNQLAPDIKARLHPSRGPACISWEKVGPNLQVHSEQVADSRAGQEAVTGASSASAVLK
jgi:hypothetical protein